MPPRKEILARINKELERIGDLKGARHTKACCELIAYPALGRFVKTDKKPRMPSEP